LSDLRNGGNGKTKNNIKNRNQGFSEKYPNVSKEKGRMRAWQVNLRDKNSCSGDK